MQDNTRLVWVESGGGPFLLLDQSLLGYWTGVFTPGANPEIDPLEGTDYGRACSVSEESVSSLDVGLGHGLVLGDVPVPVTWWPLPESGGGVVVRAYAESDDDVVAVLGHLAEMHWEETGIVLEVPSGTLCLFDSAASGAEVSGSPKVEVGASSGEAYADFLVIEVGKGSYRVGIAEYEDEDLDVELNLQRLTPVGDYSGQSPEASSPTSSM